MAQARPQCVGHLQQAGTRKQSDDVEAQTRHKSPGARCVEEPCRGRECRPQRAQQGIWQQGKPEVVDAVGGPTTRNDAGQCLFGRRGCADAARGPNGGLFVWPRRCCGPLLLLPGTPHQLRREVWCGEPCDDSAFAGLLADPRRFLQFNRQRRRGSHGHIGRQECSKGGALQLGGGDIDRRGIATKRELGEVARESWSCSTCEQRGEQCTRLMLHEKLERSTQAAKLSVGQQRLEHLRRRRQRRKHFEILHPHIQAQHPRLGCELWIERIAPGACAIPS